jgi:hypothetical protein
MLRSRIRLKSSQVSRNRTLPELSTTDRYGRSPFDWKGWVVLAWVLWFGLRYGMMVFVRRSDKISDLVALLANSL